jgi:hypothetical protein
MFGFIFFIFPLRFALLLSLLVLFQDFPRLSCFVYISYPYIGHVYSLSMLDGMFFRTTTFIMVGWL